MQGALIATTADFYKIGKTAGEKAALILNGAKPDSIPSENPKEYSIILNKKAAKDLGIVIPEDMLEKAKEVIS